MSRFVLGMIASLADALPEPELAPGGGKAVVLVVGLFASLAVLALGIIIIRRRGGK